MKPIKAQIKTIPPNEDFVNANVFPIYPAPPQYPQEDGYDGKPVSIGESQLGLNETSMSLFSYVAYQYQSISQRERFARIYNESGNLIDE